MSVESKGSSHRTENSKFVVSRWHIPGGCGYHAARVIVRFFDNEEDAKAYEAAWKYPPEMADMYPIAMHDDIIAQASKNYADYKKRFYRDFEEGYQHAV